MLNCGVDPELLTGEKMLRKGVDIGSQPSQNIGIIYPTVENSFKSWLGSHYKIMSHDQIYNMSSLYYELFGRRPKWKKGHGR